MIRAFVILFYIFYLSVFLDYDLYAKYNIINLTVNIYFFINLQLCSNSPSHNHTRIKKTVDASN